MLPDYLILYMSNNYMSAPSSYFFGLNKGILEKKFYAQMDLDYFEL